MMFVSIKHKDHGNIFETRWSFISEPIISMYLYLFSIPMYLFSLNQHRKMFPNRVNKMTCQIRHSHLIFKTNLRILASHAKFAKQTLI